MYKRQETLFAGWEMVGLSSTLLVAFYHERKGPVRNGLRVWSVYRISDAALLLAAVALHHMTGEGDFDAFLGNGAGSPWPMGQSLLSEQQALLVGLLLLVAAAGKSALVPFSGWLPRAMEGPTPSSAVFYGALSVHLGAFLLLRVGSLLELSLTLQIAGDFDDAMARVQEVCHRQGIYLVNSVNPFRLEGQKTVMLRVLEALRWEVPDWIVVPGGNLGNSSAFGKAFLELHRFGLIDRIPRLAVINASGARTLSELVTQRGLNWNGGRYDRSIVDCYYAELDARSAKASTIASAIEINRPVNLSKCLRALDVCDGVVREVSDQEILDAKAQVGAGGYGCEPASAASVAGAKLLRAEGIIGADERVVCILTGHLLKDPDATVAYHSADQQRFNETLGVRGVRRASFANHAVTVGNDFDDITRAIQLYG